MRSLTCIFSDAPWRFWTPALVRDANMGHQLAGGNSSWRPELEVWTIAPDLSLRKDLMMEAYSPALIEKAATSSGASPPPPRTRVQLTAAVGILHRLQPM